MADSLISQPHIQIDHPKHKKHFTNQCFKVQIPRDSWILAVKTNFFTKNELKNQFPEIWEESSFVRK